MKKNILLKIIIGVIILLIIFIILLLVVLRQQQSGNEATNEILEDSQSESQNVNVDGIVPNDVNQYQDVSISGASLASSYLRTYTTNALRYPEEAYNSLDEEYRKIRFHDSYEEYLQYVNELTNRLIQTNAQSYLISQRNDYREFNVLDNYENTYVIKEYAIMDYTIQLDNYTIPTEDFKTKYEAADQPTKVSTDLSIFFQMLNTKDYSHAYEKLDDGFKQNYFPTQADFENYVKQNFFDYNDIEVTSNRNEGEIFIYELSIKDGIESETTETTQRAQTTKTFLVRLGDELDFDISFNME